MKTQKAALITGSATGIGRAAAIRFAKRGLAVAVNYSRSENDARETLAEVEKHKVPALLLKADVGDSGAVREMVAQCEREFGGLDVLVNNAGYTQFIDHIDLDALTDEVWDRIFQVNVRGTFYCCREAMPLLKKRNGNIINITSVAGVAGHGSSIPYAASKAALNCMTKSLARAFGPEVRVNAVAPGPVQTRWLADHQDHVRQSVQLTPMRRPAEPDDIADTIIYLALETEFVTGQVLIVDGGRTM